MADQVERHRAGRHGRVGEFTNRVCDRFYTIVEPMLRGVMKSDSEFEFASAVTNRTCWIKSSPDLVTWTELPQVLGAGETRLQFATTTRRGGPASLARVSLVARLAQPRPELHEIP